MGTAAITTDLIVLSTQDALGVVREQSANVQSENTLRVQGTASNGFSDDGVGLNGGVSDPVFTAQDVTNTIIFQWMMNLTTPDTVAGGGMRIRVEQGVNFGEWNAGGSETYDGAFKIFAVDTTGRWIGPARRRRT